MLSTLPPPWTQILRHNFTCIDAIADFLELTSSQRQQLAYKRPFAINIPRRLASKMAKSTLQDPLVRQFVPLAEEENQAVDYTPDPLEEMHCRKGGKLLYKYTGRVLLLCTSACAMHCRYCFRQHFPYATSQNGFEEEIKIIAADTSIQEVILSGGDPLSLSHRSLKALVNNIEAISHVKRIRFHTRFPMGIPERIDDALCSLFAASNKSLWVVLHANHPAEFDSTIFHHLALLQKSGVILLHQAVLLRGINDHIDTLTQLYELLVDHGITPYYLHQLDRTSGTSHFEVPVHEGKSLIQALQAKLSGYAIPRYVHELPGASSKLSLI